MEGREKTKPQVIEPTYVIDMADQLYELSFDVIDQTMQRRGLKSDLLFLNKVCWLRRCEAPLVRTPPLQGQMWEQRCTKEVACGRSDRILSE